MPKPGDPELRLMHQLLLCALIEARSCERFRLLSEGFGRRSFAQFLLSFMVSEAGTTVCLSIWRRTVLAKKRPGRLAGLA
jgi:tRNA-(ms[2]io[6]A)-hydroxylase